MQRERKAGDQSYLNNIPEVLNFCGRSLRRDEENKTNTQGEESRENKERRGDKRVRRGGNASVNYIGKNLTVLLNDMACVIFNYFTGNKLHADYSFMMQL